MSETPVDPQPVIPQPVPDEQREEPIGSTDAASRGSGSRSLKAGGEFVRALGADLGAVTSRVRLSLAAKRRRPQLPPAPTPGEMPPRPGIGRGLWRVGMMFFGALLICSGLLSAAMLYVIFGSPLAPRHSDPGAPVLRAEAPSSPSVGPSAVAAIQPAAPQAGSTEPPKAADEAKPAPQAASNQPPPALPGVAPAAAAPTQPAAPPAADQQKPTQEAKVEPPAGSNQPQPAPTDTQARPGAGQPEMSAKLTDQHPVTPCSVDLCAATYKSFHAADCTYQPIGGGPRSLCELGAQPAATPPQTSRAATDPGPKAPDTRAAAAVQPIAASAAPEQNGMQCNRSLCAATYKSFHAADCTYQPEGGGPRSVCDLSKASDKGPADALQQPAQAAMNPRHPTADADDDVPPPGMVQVIAEPEAPDRDGAQCNRSRCAAAYQSFHAADCTYQPEGGGPRRLCEP